MGEVCHFVGHLDGIKSHLTAAENLTFWATYLSDQADSGHSVAYRVYDALEVFALDALADIPAGYMSAGQKRRLGLARLLVAHRPLWLLDEPTVSLDTGSADILVKAINRHLRDGGMAIVATHLPLAIEPARGISLVRKEAQA